MTNAHYLQSLLDEFAAQLDAKQTAAGLPACLEDLIAWLDARVAADLRKGIAPIDIAPALANLCDALTTSAKMAARREVQASLDAGAPVVFKRTTPGVH